MPCAVSVVGLMAYGACPGERRLFVRKPAGGTSLDSEWRDPVAKAVSQGPHPAVREPLAAAP